MDNTGIIADIVQVLRQDGCKLLVLTGAGISAESGIPTFRDPDGYWAKFRFEELASRDGFRNDPELVLQWYAERRRTILTAQPNPGHYALAELEGLLSELTIATQNVDGLHRKAGSQRVLELHGSILRDKCFQCERPYTKEYDLADVSKQFCECGGRIRPDVVWFGEQLPEAAMVAAEEASQHCSVCWIIGTTGAVYPAAGLAHLAKRKGAVLVEFNPKETELTGICDFVWREKSGVALPLVVGEWIRCILKQ